jgi:hypothetical protein
MQADNAAMYTKENKAAAPTRTIGRAIEAVRSVFGSGLNAANKRLHHN